MQLTNLGNHYYYPSQQLVKGLKKIIIFAENTKKRNIPNGSVYIYDENVSYNPEILKTDVGCGIISFITDEINYDNQSINNILKAVNEIGTHIGQGNHFLDFTTGHPTIKDRNTTMIFLHSDFNNKNRLPRNYSEAKDLEKKAIDTRFQYVEKLSKLLGISAEFYRDWVHNSVNKENNSLVYRKGAINLQETEGVGVLALNPIDGLLLYGGDFSEYNYSAQHGLGRIGSKGELWNKLEKRVCGMVRGYRISSVEPEMIEVKNQTYNKLDNFIDNHYLYFSQIGVCSPELVITTKKSSDF